MSAVGGHPELRAALLAEMEERSAKIDRDRVAAAFDFADQAHGDQLRESGQPFISHAVETCRILLGLLETRMETALACAALLHDVVEDTSITPSDLEKRFGKEVAGLVEGVTKLSALHFDSRESAQAENFRKMLLSMSRDLRVIFVKLADRLHNMRTLEFLPPERRQRIAAETRDIYAPLAHRLGMAGIKRELEDLALKALDPDAYQQLIQRIQARREEREAFLAEVREMITNGLKAAGIKSEVTGRPKHFYSIYQKMKAGRPLEDIYDLFGLRVITHTRNDCYRALGVVHDLMEPVADRFKDYIATPKSNLYQSLHTTVLAKNGEMVEVQIRTREMHRTAETGVAAHYVYKQGGSVDEELDAKLGGFVAQTADWQNTASDDEYMDFLRTALYQEEVYVYTPRRELKRLPKGATPLDFAFLIHTQVGQHTVGARVNGELVPLRHTLRNGDTVEIVTSPQAKPHEDWLKIVRTTGARSKIRHWLRQQRLTDSVSLGREMLERELKRLRLKPEDEELEEIARGLGCTDLDQMYARMAEGSLSVKTVLNKFKPEKETFAERLAKGPLEALGIGRKPVGGIRIQGIDNVMLHFARCCQPVPGDRVIGIVTQGRGVSVHRQDCPNTFDDRVPRERKVAVEWDAGRGETFPVRLVVYGHDRTSLLADIAKAIATTQVNIRTAGMASEDQTARGVFVVEVAHLAKLQEVIGAIRKVKGVSRVERRQRFLRTPAPRKASGDKG
ncbi:MAG TPA: bifunctional (p)ppGpp synthetase/guanosine-3',5'-bis(diphosphate) 3'-pyrophosphohydrolase [Candidatus Eisenbacteria bacterium]|nr:bifunctional (p)ppGpp synthetase/guanosine-3',5'-bis(diphosphate) 3'-pyrophosphohydrolase [Candidatus Eisenbacteria bacterium]